MLLWLLSLYDGYTVTLLQRADDRIQTAKRRCTSSPLQRKLLAYWPCISGATPAAKSAGLGTRSSINRSKTNLAGQHRDTKRALVLAMLEMPVLVTSVPQG